MSSAAAMLVGLVLFALVADRRVARRSVHPGWFTNDMVSSILISSGVSAVFVVIALYINIHDAQGWSALLERAWPLTLVAAAGGALAARVLVRAPKAEPPIQLTPPRYAQGRTKAVPSALSARRKAA